jgi:hypothetical protein
MRQEGHLHGDTILFVDFYIKQIMKPKNRKNTKKAVEQHVDEEDKLIFKLSDIQEGGVLPTHIRI